jgi:hypothetical protein
VENDHGHCQTAGYPGALSPHRRDPDQPSSVDG